MPTAKQFNTALDLAIAGATRKEILAKSKLNYSQAWCFIRTCELMAEGFDFYTEVVPAEVARLRGFELNSKNEWVRSNEEQLSWGEIGVRHQVPEGRVRRAFTEATELKHEGQRIGKGGRFYYGPVSGAPLYAAELRPTGTDIPKGANLQGAVVAADGQRLMSADLEEVKAIAKGLGISLTVGKKNRTKGDLVTRIRKARQAELASA